ncbi:GpE family phage tail protein [Dyella sp. ASV21]|nr:GpE family phage tail protein [Dyella sp. ASV21]
MSDIAVVFHWPPAAMNEMDVAELMEWREQARLRNGVEE